MTAGNCHAKFNWGSFPYLGKREVAGGPPSYHAVSQGWKEPRLKKFIGFFRFLGF